MKATTLWVLCLAFALGASGLQAHADGGMPVWTNRYNGPGNSFDRARAIAVDTNGNVFVTGDSTGTVGGYDYATIKYSRAGVALWTNRYDGPAHNNEHAWAVAVDPAGSVVVAGSSENSAFGPSDLATIKYSSAGPGMWTNRFAWPISIQISSVALAIDGTGSVFVAGTPVILKYSPTGALLWTNRLAVDASVALAVDAGGNVYVTGGVTLGINDVDWVTIKYSGAGVPLWTNRFSGTGNNVDIPAALSVDSTSNVFVTGFTYTGASTTNDFATIKYSSGGIAAWTNRYNNSPGGFADHATAVAVDAGGRVFVTGDSVMAKAPFTSGGCDYATIAYSGTGATLWTKRYNGPAQTNDYPYALAVDSAGNVFVTGYSQGSGNFYEFATVAYSGAGVALWTNRSDGPTPSGFSFGPPIAGPAIAVDAVGNVYVTGSYGSGATENYSTIKYASSLRPPLKIQRMNNKPVLSWTNSAFTLQSASSPAGTFTNVAGAKSPFTNGVTGGQQFFRLIGN